MDHLPRRWPLSSPTWLAFVCATMLWIGTASAQAQQQKAAPARSSSTAPKVQERESQDRSPGILWRTDKLAARKDALAQGKPILWYYRCDS